MMSSSMVQEVLYMQIPHARVEMALKKKGKMFNTADELASAALSVQFKEQTVNVSAPGCSNALSKPNPPQTVNETVQINDESAQNLRSSTSEASGGQGSNPAAAVASSMELEQENQ